MKSHFLALRTCGIPTTVRLHNLSSMNTCTGVHIVVRHVKVHKIRLSNIVMKLIGWLERFDVKKSHDGDDGYDGE